MATIVLDYASVDGNPPPDFVALRASGVSGVIIRGVYGRIEPGSAGPATKPFMDPCWKRDAARARAAGMKVSAYLFVCMPQVGKVTPEPEIQAQAFIDYVELDPTTDLCPFFDVEQDSTLDGNAYYAWIGRVCAVLYDHYKTWAGEYTSARVWAELLKHHSPGPLLNCPLWLAKPWPIGIKQPVHMDGMPAYSPILIPEYADQWFGYQYQGDARGWDGIIQADASRWRVFGQGSRGAHVVWVQKRAKRLVPNLVVDGIWGPATTAAVKTVQQAHGKAADGIFGLDTFQAMSWMLPA